MKSLQMAPFLLTAFLVMARLTSVQAQEQDAPHEFTVTLLGTGSPAVSIERFGPSTLVEAGGRKLVFDAGRGASIRLGQLGIELGEVDAIFLTHFHSDHVNGLADIWLTGWTYPAGKRRTAPFEIYGPVGTTDMMNNLRQAHAEDIRIRVADENLPLTGIEVNAHDVTEGIIYEEEGVRVTVFDVDHGEMIKPSFGYRVDYDGRSVVLSGDTRFSPNLVDHARGVDVVIHEVMCMPETVISQSEALQKIMNHHSSPEDAGRVFSLTGTKLGVYSHIILGAYESDAAGYKALEDRTRNTWSGRFEIGSDLMRIDVTDKPVVTRSGQ